MIRVLYRHPYDKFGNKIPSEGDLYVHKYTDCYGFYLAQTVEGEDYAYVENKALRLHDGAVDELLKILNAGPEFVDLTLYQEVPSED